MYDVILADPPWNFRVWSKKGAGRSAPYPTMSLEDICALPVANLANKNCALFLWSVWPRIFDAEKVIEAWGFTFRTIAWVWVKVAKNGNLLPGMGYYTRANTEPCLLAVKGRMPVADRSVLSVILACRRKHSQKPDAQYHKINQLYPETKRIELFARKIHPGWDAWGNEVETNIKLEA